MPSLYLQYLHQAMSEPVSDTSLTQVDLTYSTLLARAPQSQDLFTPPLRSITDPLPTARNDIF